MFLTRRNAFCFATLALLAGCRDEDKNQPPHAAAVTLEVIEDSPANGMFRGTDADGDKLTYLVVRAPGHGTVSVDAATGAFAYLPHPDYFGADAFVYAVSDGSQSGIATVAISISNVNDPPTLQHIPDLRNSADSHVVVYQPQPSDVDRDNLSITARSGDTGVASIEVDALTGSLRITPLEHGSSTIEVTVSDGQLTDSKSFQFLVGEVSKSSEVLTDPTQGISIHNTAGRSVEFTFEHNGFPMFQSDEQIVEYVRAMPAEYLLEPFERKLWRFVRDHAYHAVQLSNDNWPVDPWVTINSFGWGLCTQVAAVYIRAARAAGYSSRMWGLEGHVVPEIRINGEWQMYDPDLAVYYLTRASSVAGVSELELDTTLITAPTDPIFDLDVYDYPYSELIAGLYGEPLDNVAASENATMAATNYQPLRLPAGASLTYPVAIDSSVTGMHNGQPFAIPHYIQAALTLEEGWTGELAMPWIVWGISGEGLVIIDDVEYDIGSQLLENRIRNTLVPITSIDIVGSASGITLTFFINALRYELAPWNSVILTGKDVWALDVATVVVPEDQRLPWNRSLAYRKLRGGAR